MLYCFEHANATWFAMMTESNDGICIACGCTIPSGVSFCHVCKSHQSIWRNELKYWSGITGLSTLIVSGGLFATGLVVTLYNDLFGAELAVTELDLLGESAIWNMTEDNVWVTTLRAASKVPDYDLQWDIFKVVEAKGDLVFNIGKMTADQWHGTVAEMFDPNNVSDYAENIPAADFNRLKENFAEEKRKYVPGILYTKGAEYRQIERRHRGKLTEIKFTCKLDYIVLTEEISRIIDIPCVGVLRHRKQISN